MNNFQVISFKCPDTKATKIGFIHDISSTKTKLIFLQGQDIRSYGTTPRIKREQMLTMLTCKPVDESKLDEGLKEFRSKLMNPASFKKGECASFMDEGKTVTGRVIKGGKGRIVVAINNGNTDVELEANDCKPVELPPSTGAMANWQVSNYRIVHGHDDSTPYVADILHKGKKALISENDGWGGPDMMSLAKGASRELEHQFGKDIMAAVKSATGSADAIPEPEGMWVIWDYFIRPCGEQTFEEHLAEFHESLKNMMARRNSP